MYLISALLHVIAVLLGTLLGIKLRHKIRLGVNATWQIAKEGVAVNTPFKYAVTLKFNIQKQLL